VQWYVVQRKRKVFALCSEAFRVATSILHHPTNEERKMRYVLGHARNKTNKQMSDNKLNFLKSQISAFHPEWTKEQIEMEAIRINNEANSIDDDDEGCLYCGS
jgi:hypothetical protein